MKAKVVVTIALSGLVVAGLVALLPQQNPDAALAASQIAQAPVVLNPALQNHGPGFSPSIMPAPSPTPTTPSTPDPPPAMANPTLSQVGLTVINGSVYVITANNPTAATNAGTASRAVGGTTPLFRCSASDSTNSADYTAWLLANNDGAPGSSPAPPQSMACTLADGSQQ
jgi:hypothetical protein